MPSQKFVNATISAATNNTQDILLIHQWLEKWGPSLHRCLEWGSYREEIFEVVAPENALNELPRDVWIYGRPADQFVQNL